MPETSSNPLSYVPPKRLRLIGYVAGGVAILIVVVGLVTRVMASREVDDWTEANALPTVSVINLQSGANGRLALPGNVQAFNSSPIYARVSGYLKKWYVDIGTKVKAGQLLAEIDIPDQDQQLAQARADLGTAIANQKLAAVTAKRWNDLAKQNAVAPQDVDTKNANLAAMTAAVASAKANVDRLVALEGFKSIVAPFDGTVTSRAVDVGDLVTVPTTTTTGSAPLFTVADDSKVRIYVNVPQNYSEQIKPGMKANFTVPQHPGQVFVATLVANAESVNTQTGTILIQFQADNADNMFNPGDYAQVTFDLVASGDAIRLPASTLIFSDSGPQVAVVGPRDRVILKPVTILRDYGTSVEVSSGLTRHDRVVDNPPDSLRQGDQVRLATLSAPH
ncbi:MAG: efflux RND transporter periplasmic adaptor subunit [Rhizomicrobium sp.]